MPRIITVSREFASGGRELGRYLAVELGFSYYDREIVTRMASETGLDELYLENQMEKSVMSPMSTHYAQSFSQIATNPDPAVQILAIQTRLLKELAAKGDCVVVGRAADVILEGFHPFKLFVCADEASKLQRCRERASEEEKMSDREMQRWMKRIDKARAEYHDIISTYSWGDKAGYHLCVNTTGLNLATLAPAIANYYRLWEQAAHLQCAGTESNIK